MNLTDDLSHMKCAQVTEKYRLSKLTTLEHLLTARKTLNRLEAGGKRSTYFLPNGLVELEINSRAYVKTISSI